MNYNNNDKRIKIENIVNRKKSVGKKSSEQKQLRSKNADSSDSNDLETYKKPLLNWRANDSYDGRGWIMRNFKEPYKQILPPEMASSATDDQISYVKDLFLRS
jgi:hypothetical protein